MRNLKFFVFLFFLHFVFFVIGCKMQAALPTEEDRALVKEQPDNLDIYLLIGQSNMADRAEIELQDLDTIQQNSHFIRNIRKIQVFHAILSAFNNQNIIQFPDELNFISKR